MLQNNPGFTSKRAKLFHTNPNNQFSSDMMQIDTCSESSGQNFQTREVGLRDAETDDNIKDMLKQMAIFQAIGDALLPVSQEQSQDFVFLPCQVGFPLKGLDEESILKAIGGYTSAYQGLPSFTPSSNLVSQLKEIYRFASSTKPATRDPLIVAALVGEEKAKISRLEPEQKLRIQKYCQSMRDARDFPDSDIMQEQVMLDKKSVEQINEEIYGHLKSIDRLTAEDPNSTLNYLSQQFEAGQAKGDYKFGILPSNLTQIFSNPSDYKESCTSLSLQFDMTKEYKDSSKVDVTAKGSYGGFFSASGHVDTEKVLLTNSFQNVTIEGDFLSGTFDRKQVDLQVFSLPDIAVKDKVYGYYSSGSEKLAQLTGVCCLLPIKFLVVKNLYIEFSGNNSQTDISKTLVEASAKASFGIFSAEANVKCEFENQSSSKSNQKFTVKVQGPVLFGVQCQKLPQFPKNPTAQTSSDDVISNYYLKLQNTLLKQYVLTGRRHSLVNKTFSEFSVNTRTLECFVDQVWYGDLVTGEQIQVDSPIYPQLFEELYKYVSLREPAFKIQSLSESLKEYIHLGDPIDAQERTDFINWLLAINDYGGVRWTDGNDGNYYFNFTTGSNYPHLHLKITHDTYYLYLGCTNGVAGGGYPIHIVQNHNYYEDNIADPLIPAVAQQAINDVIEQWIAYEWVYENETKA